jgi:uncharacterized protein (DUF58 family)
MPVNTEYRRFLDPVFLKTLKNMEVAARFLVDGMYASRHRCPFYGYSVEFKDLREYVQGDDPRSIDWKMFARTEKVYVKRFEMESNMDVMTLLDVSASMGYQSPFDKRRLTKIEFGRFLAAGISYLVNNQQDSAGLMTFDTELRAFLPCRQGRRHLNAILITLDQARSSDRTAVDLVLQKAGMRLKRRGLVALISDCYGNTDDIVSAIRLLRARGQDTIVFHVADDDEINLPFDMLTSFHDMETNREVMCDPVRQKRHYVQRFQALRDKLAKGCAECGADYVFAQTSQPIEMVLRDYLIFRRARG